MGFKRKNIGTVVESECGLLFEANKDLNLIHFGTCYIGNTEYSDELGKLPLRCPYGKRCDKSTLPVTYKSYEYENSGDKIYQEYLNQYKNECKEIALTRTRSISSSCEKFIHVGKGKAELNLLSVCRSEHCKNEVCVLTGRQRDKTMVHIWGDREQIVDEGMITEHKAIVKGIRITAHQITKDLAEKIIAEYEEFTAKQWSYYHNYPKPTKFYTSSRKVKDLMQDLIDAREGLEVLHNSDLEKNQKIEKTKRLQENKRKREERKIKKVKKEQSASNYKQVSLFEVV